MTLPDYINRENYFKSKELYDEALIAWKRAFGILIWSTKRNYSDFHGSIEALQHCIELCLKSIWILFGLIYPKNHDPTQDLENINAKLYEIFPYLNKEPIFIKWNNWIKEKGRFYANIHFTTIYGDENKGLVASKLFTENDMNKIFKDAGFILEFSRGFFDRVGKRLDLLTEEELNRLESEHKIISYIKEHDLEPAIRKIVDDYLNKVDAEN